MAGDPLADAEHLGFSAGQVVEETVDGRQALVAGAYVVLAVDLEMAEKADHPVEGEVPEE